MEKVTTQDVNGSSAAGEGRKPVPVANGVQRSPLRLPLAIKLMEAVIENYANDRPIFAGGVQVRAVEVAQPDFLLPAILVSAAEQWAPVVVARKGGGFHLRLRSNPAALLGMEVQEIDPSAPFLFFMPALNVLRACDRNEEIDLEPVIEEFSAWILKNKINAELSDDVDIKIAMRVMEGD